MKRARGHNRDQQFRIRASAEELDMLHALAERTGLSAADIIRTHIRELHALHFGAPPAKPTATKRAARATKGGA